MAFGLKQDDLIKYALGGAATIGILALLIGSAQEDAPAPVRKGPKPYASTAGASGFDVSQAYQGDMEDEDDYYDSYQGEDDDDDYYSYPADIVVGDHTGHQGPGIPPGPHPGPGPVGGGTHPPGPIHPGMDGHPGGPAGFRWGGQRFPLQRYHVTNNMWNWFRGFPRGIFPGTPQLGYPYHPQQYPFFTSPFQCQRFPFSLMPQCRRFRRTPFHWPWQNQWNRRPFQWGGYNRPGFPGGHPGMPGGHPGMPGPHPGPGMPPGPH